MSFNLILRERTGLDLCHLCQPEKTSFKTYGYSGTGSLFIYTRPVPTCTSNSEFPGEQGGSKK